MKILFAPRDQPMCNHRPVKHGSYLVASVLLLMVAPLGGATAWGATCEDFTIYLKNETYADIKATKFEYKDGSNWKTENIFGPIGYKRLDKIESEDYKRNLQGIGSESTQFRVTYKSWTRYNVYEPYMWSDDVTYTTPTFTCHDNGVYWVRLR